MTVTEYIDFTIVKIKDYQEIPFSDSKGWGTASIDPLDFPYEFFDAFYKLVEDKLIEHPNQEILQRLINILDNKDVLQLIIGLDKIN